MILANHEMGKTMQTDKYDAYFGQEIKAMLIWIRFVSLELVMVVMQQCMLQQKCLECLNAYCLCWAL